MTTARYIQESISPCACGISLQGGLELLEFVKTPEDRELARGPYVHYEECKATVVDGQAFIMYFW